MQRGAAAYEARQLYGFFFFLFFSVLQRRLFAFITCSGGRVSLSVLSGRRYSNVPRHGRVHRPGSSLHPDALSLTQRF